MTNFNNDKKKSTMILLNYRPGDDQFWIGCTFEEAEANMLPLMSPVEVQKYHDLKSRRSSLSEDEQYMQTIRECYDISEVPKAYFNVSRDLKVCYPEFPLFPFAGQWNGYSPFVNCDHVEIHDLGELKQMEATYDGKPIHD